MKKYQVKHTPNQKVIPNPNRTAILGNFIKNNYLVIFIVLCGAFLRFYRIADLAVFLADQASDSMAVRNLVNGDFTLLGPITSVGGFYNGPIVYYLMTPFYFAFKSDPLSGTLFQSVLSLATIPFVYLIGKKLQNKTVGLIASFLFAISPLMIDYSRAAFNSYPAVFFSTVILYIFIRLNESYSHLKALVMGILLGFIMQMHYFTLAYHVLVLIHPLLFKTPLKKLSYYLLVLSGILIGFSPFLLFEIRHQFLNINLFLTFMVSGKESAKSLMNPFLIWPDITARLLFGNILGLGVLGLGAVIVLMFKLFKQKSADTSLLKIILTLFVCVFLIGLLYRGFMQTHYVISFHTPIILLAALCIYELAKTRLRILSVLIIILVINSTAWNIEKPKHPLQQGLHIRDFQNAARIIDDTVKRDFNVAMHAQGDNRAMPLRYMLTQLDRPPQNYDTYNVSELYFLIPRKEKISEQKMWEYTSFGKSKVQQTWMINEEYTLYKLIRETNQ